MRESCWDLAGWILRSFSLCSTSMKSAQRKAAPIFSLEIDPHQIGIARLDLPGEKVNKLSSLFVGELEQWLASLHNERDLKGIILISGKDDNFLVGGDISELRAIRSAKQAEKLSLKAQEVISKLASMKVPTIAAIHGACLGGGLEMALACSYRVATDDPRTVLGFPEIEVGLIPGAGGTQRLPQLVGIRTALDLLLTGRRVGAREAHRIGLVDEIVPKEALLIAAREAALRIASRELDPEENRPGIRSLWDLFDPKKVFRARNLSQALLEKNPLGRAYLFARARKDVLKKTQGHSPALLKVLEVIQKGMLGSLEQGLDLEATLFGELVVSSVARRLMDLFLSVRELKGDAEVGHQANPREVRKLGIVGVGFMGSAIAAVAADGGIVVRMKEKDDLSLGKGFKFCYDYFNAQRRQGKLSLYEMQAKLNLVSGSCDYSGFKTVDLVIEAVFETLSLKQRVLAEVEAATREDCIFASHTFSLPIGEISRASVRPEQVIGMHFFSPVHQRPLVEIVVTRKTADWVTATALELSKRLGKVPIVVNDGAGFYTTRILTPYLNEAGHLLDEGAAIDAVDQAMVAFGFPLGPFSFLDEVGIDVAAKAAAIMHQVYGARLAHPRGLQRIAEFGRMGRKNKRGFYQYNDKRGGVDKTVYLLLPFGSERRPVAREDVQERLVLALLNEAALCLQEGILRRPRDGDVGAVMGLGFPPFLGGPFRYIDSVGAESIVRKLENLHSRFQSRFAPAEILLEMARRGKKFYP